MTWKLWAGHFIFWDISSANLLFQKPLSHLEQIHWKTMQFIKPLPLSFTASENIEFLKYNLWKISGYRVLTSTERWRIMLFSQLALIPQLCLQFFEKLKYHTLGKWKFSSLFYMWKIVFPRYIFCRSAFERSFTPIISYHRVLAFLISKVLSDRD